VAPAPLADGAPPQPGLRLVHAAYAADRRFVLSAHFGCHLVSGETEPPFWINDCDTHPGSSGGPLFAESDGVLKIAAVMVAGSARQYNLALPLSEWMPLARNAICP
jgi:V8-like Glu-specific endopeptidase